MPKRNVFLAASPCHYLFSVLVSRMFPNDHNEVAIYLIGNDFSASFDAIETILETSIPRTSVDCLDLSEPIDRLFLSDRCNENAVSLWYALKKSGRTDLCLYEEGISNYLPSVAWSKYMSDTNRWLRLKDTIKLLIGRLPSHIYAREFRTMYTLFDDIMYRRPEALWVSLMDEFSGIRDDKFIHQTYP